MAKQQVSADERLPHKIYLQNVGYVLAGNRRPPLQRKQRESERAGESMRIVVISRPVQLLVIWPIKHCGCYYKSKIQIYILFYSPTSEGHKRLIFQLYLITSVLFLPVVFFFFFVLLDWILFVYIFFSLISFFL